MNTAAIYARYSSNKQTDDSIEAQLRACRTYATTKGLSVVNEYIDEAVSGKGSKTASRAQYQRLLRDCDKGLFDAILIHKYDRIARNVGEHINLEQKLTGKGIELIAVSQDFGKSNEAKIMRTLTFALSEYYLDNLSDETRKGHKEKAVEALHNGGVPPFGYDVVDQKYVINDLEAGFVRKIFAAAAGREGFKTIIEEMASCGVKGKRGKSIKYTQIYEMLRNVKYTGTYVYSPKEEKNREDRRTKPNAIKIENAIPAIVDKELFEEVQRIMEERKQTGTTRVEYLCSGLVYCTCGAKMHGRVSKNKDHEYHYFYCSDKCGASTVRMEDVDTAAKDYLHALLSPENQQKIAAAIREYNAGESDRIKEFNTAVKKQIHEKQDKYDRLMDRLATEELPSEVVRSIGAKMKTLLDEINGLKEATPPKDFTTNQITTWLESLKAAPDEKAIHLLIERIDVETSKNFSISSTLKSVVGKTGCGGRI